MDVGGNAIIERVGELECPFLGNFPWNYGLDNRQRLINFKDPGQTYPLGPLNQRELVELGSVYGREGYDFQNPYAWAARGVLAYPNPASSGIVPHYGVGDSATPADIALNVRGTAGTLEVGPL